MSLHRGAPNAEKGARYLGLLDHALCHGQWSEVPELARKVEKHAPQRKCTALCLLVLYRPYVDPFSQTSPSLPGPNVMSSPRLTVRPLPRPP